MGYDPVRDSYQSPTQSSSRESTVTESSSNSRRMHGKLADLLSPTDTVAEATNSVSFFDPDPARAEPLPHPQPSPPSETKKRLYDPKRISAAKDLIRPLKKEDLWINPNLNLLRLPSAAIAQKQQNGNTGGAKRPAEEELPARPQKFAKAQEAITSHCE